MTPTELQHYLAGVDFPASKQDLIRSARRQHAPDDIVATLRGLPEQEFGRPADIRKAVA